MAPVAGVVEDPSGAAVAGATVSLAPAEGAAQSVVTGADGRFRFAEAAEGRYQLRLEVSGFKPVAMAVRVGAKAAAPLRVRLELAELRQEMAVDGGTAQPSAEPGGNLDSVRLTRQAIRGLPVLGTDVVAAAADLLDASALGTGGASVVVDGMETDELGATASAIAEVRINQDPYSAEYFRPGRGRIEVITKAGGDAFHGEVNFLFRDSLFDARNAFSGARPNEQRRIFEGSLTGPLGKGGRTAFVISAEREREDLEAVVYALTPDGEYRANFPQPRGEDEWNFRVSRQIGKAHTLAVRYELGREFERGRNVGGFTLPEAASDLGFQTHHIFVNYRGMLSSSLVNDFSMRIGRHNRSESSRTDAPSIVALDAFTGGGAQTALHATEGEFTFSDALSWTRGRHLMKFGVSVPEWTRYGATDRSLSGGAFTFSSLEDYARRTPLSYVAQGGEARLVYWQKEASLFVQDNWQLRPNLSLAFGLRWDWQSHLADRNNFAPRFSTAWSPGGDRRTVLRAGAGVFYDRTGEEAIADMLRYDGLHLRRILIESPGYPDPGGAAADEPASLVRFAAGLRSPYLLQGSAGVERELAPKLTATLNYTRVRGLKSFRSRDVNAPRGPLYAGRIDPSLGAVRQVESSGRLSAQSLEAALRGRMSRHFQGFVQYRLGSAWNDTAGLDGLPADSWDLGGEWAPAAFDVRHRFTVMGVLRPEKLLHLGVKLDLSSGTPYSTITGRDDNRDGMALDRPAGVRRNSARLPAVATLDLRWSREFPLRQGEGAPGFEITVDAFNALNRVNVASVSGNLSSPLFGRAVAARAPRQVQFGVQFKF